MFVSDQAVLKDFVGKWSGEECSPPEPEFFSTVKKRGLIQKSKSRGRTRHLPFTEILLVVVFALMHLELVFLAVLAYLICKYFLYVVKPDFRSSGGKSTCSLLVFCR